MSCNDMSVINVCSEDLNTDYHMTHEVQIWFLSDLIELGKVECDENECYSTIKIAEIEFSNWGDSLILWDSVSGTVRETWMAMANVRNPDFRDFIKSAIFCVIEEYLPHKLDPRPAKSFEDGLYYFLSKRLEDCIKLFVYHHVGSEPDYIAQILTKFKFKTEPGTGVYWYSGDDYLERPWLKEYTQTGEMPD